MTSTPAAGVKSVCCHTLNHVDQRALGMTLITQPCNRLWENCSVEGCSTVQPVATEDDDAVTKVHTVCDCKPNIMFYVYVIVAIIGAWMGLSYMPPNTAEAEQQPQPPNAHNKVLGTAGHCMWLSFFVYCFFRATSHSASAQLDKTCAAKNLL